MRSLAAQRSVMPGFGLTLGFTLTYLSLLVLTIDELDAVSKKHGAATTDSIIKGVAHFLMGIIRDVDIPARYDNNTFLVLCPDTSSSPSLARTESWRKQRRQPSSTASQRHRPLAP